MKKILKVSLVFMALSFVMSSCQRQGSGCYYGVEEAQEINCNDYTFQKVTRKNA